MRRKLRWLCTLAATLVATGLGVSSASASSYLLDYVGYSYYTQAGTCFNAVGFVPEANATYLAFNHSANEYTFSLKDVCFVSADTVGTHVIHTYSNGTLDVYCDSKTTGTPADYSTNPPNGTSPGTFEDGDNVLGGSVSTLTVVIDLSTGTGDFSGEITVDRGSSLGNIPPDQRSGWTISGISTVAPGIPTGYFGQVDGQIFLDCPTGTEAKSWGAIKKSLNEEGQN